jgi:thioester reductase-like protein
MPQVSGAFLNCLVRANSNDEASEKLLDALQCDGYTVLAIENVDSLDGMSGQTLPELTALLKTLEHEHGDVVYGDFYCYE